MENKTKFIRVLSIFVCFMLIAATALTVIGCQSKDSDASEASDGQSVSFTFVVVDQNGSETSFAITTTEKTVGAALLKEGLIEGEDGQYGLYVKKVNGITADYNVDGTYWAFYVNGEYAMSGVDTTDIEPGATYAFKVEKG